MREKMEITMFTLWRHVQRSWIMMIQKSKFITKYENTTTSIYNIHTLLFQLLIVYLWTFIHSWIDFHKICIFNIAKVFLWIQKLSHCILFHIIYYFIRCECFCFILLRISLMYVVHIKLCCCNLTFRTLHFEK